MPGATSWRARSSSRRSRLDRYKIQWITGLEGVAGLTSLFASIYLMKVFGARRVFLLGAVCLAVGALGESWRGRRWSLASRGCCELRGVLADPRPDHAPAADAGAESVRLLHLVGPGVRRPGDRRIFGALLAFHPSWRALFVGLGACGVALVLIALCLFPDDRPSGGRNTASTSPARACSWSSSGSSCSCCTAATTWAGA